MSTSDTLMQRRHLCLACGKENVKITEMGWGGRSTKGENQCAMTTKTECPDCGCVGHISNAVPWRGIELPEDKLRAIFTMAGIKILDLKKLPNGYWGNAYEGAHPWWFVKTSRGWIEIGWRKRVISIDWSDTDVRVIVTEDDLTKGNDHVHAYSEEKAIEYLTALGKEFNKTVLSTSIQ